jgi:aspartokinase
MPPIDYRALYDNAISELARLEAEAAALRQTIAAIAPLVNESAPSGLTDAIRAILAKAGEPLSASDIRDRLADMGFDMKSYSNPLATIHTILRRLTESDEANVQKESKIEPIAGKRFVLGKKVKGFIGIATINRRYSTSK